MPRWLYILLVFSVLAIVLDFLPVQPLLIFVVAALGIIPLAALIGQSVEEVAEHTGEQIGGLLFATFGNATELIIGILALSKGLIDVVRASIIGSILGNLLLVLGISVCIGAFKHGRLRFETRPASQYASLLALSIGGLLLPSIANLLALRGHERQIAERVVQLSDFVVVVLLLGYIASILFSVFHLGDKADGAEEDLEPLLGARSEAAIDRLLTYRHELAKSAKPGKSGALSTLDNAITAITAHEAANQTDVTNEHVSHVKPPLWRGLLLLTVATVGVAVLSEILVGTIEPMTETLHWNAAFVGLIFVPLIGGLPEYFNTIKMALDKRIGMVLAASAGSSIQIALLMTPILVLVSLLTSAKLDLVFSLIELAVLALATFLFSEITRDGELVWLEGILLILLYAVMGGTIFLFGQGSLF
jgi:Ca2+:H+ antiporter